jgi:glycosyltransferase involved in cell wall biosynthesis
MRIIFLEAVQDHGGARLSTIDLARNLVQLGHEVLIVDFWGSCIPFVEDVKNNNLKLKVLSERSAPFILSSSNRLRYLWNAGSYFGHWMMLKGKLKLLINDFLPDVIAVNNAKCLSAIPSVYKGDIHYFIRVWYLNRQRSKTESYLLRRYATQIKFFTVANAISHCLFNNNIASLEDIRVLYDFVDLEKVERKRKDVLFDYWGAEVGRKFILHHCGGFIETKGQLLSIEIARKLRILGIEFKLNLTGSIYNNESSNNYYNKMLKLINEYDLENHIDVIITPGDILDYFVKSDVLLFPTSTEGLPRVAIESMAFSKPVIANPVGGIIEIVQNNQNGFLADYNDIDDYVDLIISLYSDKQLYIKLSQGAYDTYKSNFSNSQGLARINKYYPLK